MTEGTDPTLAQSAAASRPVRVTFAVMGAVIVLLLLFTVVLGAGVVHAHVTTLSQIAETTARVATLEESREKSITAQHQRELATVRELTELRGQLGEARVEVQVVTRLLVDALNELRELRGKPATSFSRATEDARRRVEQDEVQ